MARNRTRIAAPPSAVWSTLADPYSYPRWVVGSDHTVSADSSWPMPGAAFQVKLATRHSDRTEVLELDPGRRLVLEVGSFTGPARVVIELEPDGDDTQVTLIEDPAGKLKPLRYLPPVQWLIKARNVESLRRLRRICEDAG